MAPYDLLARPWDKLDDQYILFSSHTTYHIAEKFQRLANFSLNKIFCNLIFEVMHLGHLYYNAHYNTISCIDLNVAAN